MNSHSLRYYLLMLFVPLAIFIISLSGCASGNNSNTIYKQDLIALLDKVADYQLDTFTCLPLQAEGNQHDYGMGAWTNGVLYLGVSRWSAFSETSSRLNEWLMQIGTESQWTIPANFEAHPKYLYYHADELCVGQFYLDMYAKYKENHMLTSVQERVDWIMSHPGDTSMHYRNKQSWSWCDALFMAPPVYAQLSQLTVNQTYLTYMHTHFLRSYSHLYDTGSHLFYRDDSYFDKKEANGKKVFWGRGNGWALAGIVRILEYLPPDSKYRYFYQGLFAELSTRLIELQDKNGFWHASLLDPDSYPSPETSSTALITFGLAYGVNNGLLDDSCLPAIRKAWHALTSVVDEKGKVGFVQPIGADPKAVTRDMTAVYGVGALLLAGTEIIKLHNTI